MADIEWPRRDLLLAPMLAALLPPAAQASPLNPAETVITLPPDIPWQVRPTYPKDSVISAPLYGSRTGHAGSFVHRVARTPHYDGVVASAREPAIIAICGMAPVDMKYLAPTTPPWRKVT